MYELSNFDYVLSAVSLTKLSGGSPIHDPHANSLAHYPLDYKHTVESFCCRITYKINKKKFIYFNTHFGV